jgi:hypothetical protein
VLQRHNHVNHKRVDAPFFALLRRAGTMLPTAIDFDWNRQATAPRTRFPQATFTCIAPTLRGTATVGIRRGRAVLQRRDQDQTGRCGL